LGAVLGVASSELKTRATARGFGLGDCAAAAHKKLKTITVNDRNRISILRVRG
jgi:hypothetical protein